MHTTHEIAALLGAQARMIFILQRHNPGLDKRDCVLDHMGEKMVRLKPNRAMRCSQAGRRVADAFWACG